jgi:antitoxin CptB
MPDAINNDSTDNPENVKFNRLYWHSRRGMLELDIILIPFLKEVYNTLPEEDQVRYENLLECEDPDLFSWLMRNGKPKDPDTARIISLIIKHVRPD